MIISFFLKITDPKTFDW